MTHSIPVHEMDQDTQVFVSWKYHFQYLENAYYNIAKSTRTMCQCRLNLAKSHGYLGVCTRNAPDAFRCISEYANVVEISRRMNVWNVETAYFHTDEFQWHFRDQILVFASVQAALKRFDMVKSALTQAQRAVVRLEEVILRLENQTVRVNEDNVDAHVMKISHTYFELNQVRFVYRDKKMWMMVG